MTGWRRLCRILSAMPEPVAAASQYKIAIEAEALDLWRQPGVACPLDSSIQATASGTYAPLGGATTDTSGNVWYSSSNAAFFGDGWTFTDGPRPSTACHGLGFPAYGVTGGDAGGVAVASIVQFVFSGAGTLTATWADYDGAYNIAWSQGYKTASDTVVEQSGTEAMAGTLIVTVGALPGDAVSCYRYVSMRIDAAGGGGSKGTFAGLAWVSSDAARYATNLLTADGQPLGVGTPPQLLIAQTDAP